MRVLVTGATGFIGQHLTKRLLDLDIETQILVRGITNTDLFFSNELKKPNPRLKILFADLRNFNLTARAVKEADPHVVFHLAAAGVTNPFLSVENALRHNLYGTLNLIRACFNESVQNSHPQRLIIARTPGEKNAMNVYAASKASAWAFCQMYAQTQGWPIIGATIYQAYGPGQSTQALIPSAMAAAVTNEDFPMTDGIQVRDWIYITDLTDGLIALMSSELRPGEIIDLGTGCQRTVAEVVQTIFDQVGGTGRPLIGALPNRPGEASFQVADENRTQNYIGWKSTISLEQGIKQMLSHKQK